MSSPTLAPVCATTASEAIPDFTRVVDPGLRTYLEEILILEVPEPVRPSNVEPTIRRWSPSRKATPASFRFLDRHPLFDLTSSAIPVRTVKRLSRSAKRGWRGVFQSLKTKRSMHHHTGIELAVLRVCEVDSSVSTFVEHPARLSFDIGNRQRALFPSVFAVRGGDPWFIACRQEASASSARSEALWLEIGAALGAAGYGFEVVTELHFRRQPEVANVETLLRGRWADLPDEASVRNTIEASAHRPTVASLAAACGVDELQIYRLVLIGWLHVDLTKPIGPAAEIWDRPFAPAASLWGMA